VTYDAVVFTVAPVMQLSASPGPTGLNLSWTGGSAPFVGERTDELAPPT